jgi:hypothetical protein
VLGLARKWHVVAHVIRRRRRRGFGGAKETLARRLIYNEIPHDRHILHGNVLWVSSHDDRYHYALDTTMKISTLTGVADVVVSRHQLKYATLGLTP